MSPRGEKKAERPMKNQDLLYTSAVDLLTAYRDRTISPVEVTKAILDHVETTNPTLNAFAQFAPERALDDARRAEGLWGSGEDSKPLLGVPVTIKDTVGMRDMPPRSGSMTTAAAKVARDVPVAQRLIDAGTVILGKTTTSEFGWSGVSWCPQTGKTHNPWKLDTNAGASSAGAGAAAAAGYGPLHQGGDGAGSIRMPAHFCGIYGLKPTYGRVPISPVALSDLTATVGPMTRSVADAALMLDVMAGDHPADFTTLPKPAYSYYERLGERPSVRRIAYSADLGHARVDPEVAEISLAAAQDLARELGCELEIVTPEWGPKGPDIERLLWAAHMTRAEPNLAKWESQMDPGLVACIKDGIGITMSQYMAGKARKYEYVTEIHRWFEDYDLLLTPAVSIAAFPLPDLIPHDWPQHSWDWLQWAEFSYPFNLSGSPAASIPAGLNKAGLPVGLQIVGRRLDELTVLQASARFESIRPFTTRPTAYLSARDGARHA